MGAIASQITSLAIVYSIVYSCWDQRNIKFPRHWPLCEEFTGTGEFPAQMPSNAENVSIWWRHHDRSILPMFLKSASMTLVYTIVPDPGTLMNIVNLGSWFSHQAHGALAWRHYERHGVWNHWQIDCLLNRVFRLTSKETSHARVTGPLWWESDGDWWISLTKGQ